MPAKNHVTLTTPLARKSPEKICADIIRKAFAAEDTVLIAVGGPGGSGKSTFCKKLAAIFSESSSLLSLDDYKTPRAERADKMIYGPHPEANRMELIKEHLTLLKKGESIEKPCYDAVSGTADKTEKLNSASYIIIDGEIATYSFFSALTDFSIFIDSDWKTQLNTRITRDIEVRKYNREKAIMTFLKSNLDEFLAFGAESKKKADVHIFCRSDYRLMIESVSKSVYEYFSAATYGSFKQLEEVGGAVRVIFPFKKDETLDLDSFLKLLDWLSFQGVQRIIISECYDLGFLLSDKEVLSLIELALEFFPGLVLFETYAGNIDDLTERIQFLELIGVDILLINMELVQNLDDICIESYTRLLEKSSSLPVFINDYFCDYFSVADSEKRIKINSITSSEVNSDFSKKYNKHLRRYLAERLKGFPLFLRAPFS